MNASLAPASTPPMSAPAASIKTFPSASWTTSTNGRRNSATGLTKPRNYSPTIESGKVEPKTSVSFLPQTLSTTPSLVSCSEAAVYLGMYARANHTMRTIKWSLTSPSV